MSKSSHVSETPATAFLKKHGVAFSEHVYEYEDRGGTRVSAQKLDAWVVNAGEELHREVLEVLNATRDARKGGEKDEAAFRAEVEGQEQRLGKARTRIEELRANLWGPKDKLRVADSQPQLPHTD